MLVRYMDQSITDYKLLRLVLQVEITCLNILLVKILNGFLKWL